LFFTVALADRTSDLLVREVAALRWAVMRTRAERPFRVDAWVVLPDHMHCIWTLPAGDADYSTRMGAIKGRFSQAVRRSGFTPTPHPFNPHGVIAGRAMTESGVLAV
jgi:putative transposase